MKSTLNRTPKTALPLAQRAQAVLAAELQDGPVPSPCVCICTMNAKSGLCDGCLRSIQEIAGWSSMADAGKRHVWALVEQRAAAHPVKLALDKVMP